MIRCALVAGLCCACHSDDTTTPDGSTSSAAGITIHWTSKPGTWPGAVQDGVSLESARFAFDNLRVIGDAGPGDLRTTKRSFSVRWDESSSPDIIDFGNAPPGLYSQLALQIDGHLVEDSYRLEGVAKVNGVDWQFRIEDSNAMPITLSIDQMVEPGTHTDIDIDIDFTHALDAVDWASLPVDDGHLELDTATPGMDNFRKKLVESFKTPTFSAHHY